MIDFAREDEVARLRRWMRKHRVWIVPDWRILRRGERHETVHP